MELSAASKEFLDRKAAARPFELLVIDRFRRDGWQVTDTASADGDDGEKVRLQGRALGLQGLDAG